MNDEDLKTRVDVLESFVMKHFAHLYARVDPAEVPTTIDGMRSIYDHPTSEKKPAPRLADATLADIQSGKAPRADDGLDARTKAMAAIYVKGRRGG